jgi:hypothetical protein
MTAQLWMPIHEWDLEYQCRPSGSYGDHKKHSKSVNQLVKKDAANQLISKTLVPGPDCMPILAKQKQGSFHVKMYPPSRHCEVQIEFDDSRDFDEFLIQIKQACFIVSPPL